MGDAKNMSDSAVIDIVADKPVGNGTSGKSIVKKKRRGKGGKNGGAREGGGRKALAVSDFWRKKVTAMSAHGVPVDQIAATVMGGIDVVTLYKYFRKDMVEGQATINEKIGGKLASCALEGDTTAMIWWTKTRMGWSELKRHELTGADGGPVEFTKIERIIIDPKVDPDEVE